ncbi:probable GATA transcription factor 27 at N-terminal half [Coccomyxa sp. Obi]|nr:probable GATA transcription factor 27 at N-terminal half [Coccomyxa sp. Obi]
MRSGSGGPCRHCMTTTSVCWRKGPEDKPVLCNACGARYLVKRSLDGYFPHSRPVTKKDGPGHKRSPTDSKRGRKPTKSLIRPNSLSRNGRTVVDRGTQTVVHPQLFVPSGLTLHDGAARISGPPSLFTLSPAKVFNEDEFNNIAVSTLTLLRNSDSNSDSAEDGTSTPTPIIRRNPRKPSATIRALF